MGRLRLSRKETEAARAGPESLPAIGAEKHLRERGVLVPVGELGPVRNGEIEALVRAGLAVVQGGRIRLTAAGMDVHSAVAERLFGG